jgi:hypothetical protein
MKKSKKRDEGIRRRRIQVKKAARLLYEYSQEFSGRELLELVEVDALVLLYEAYSNFYKKHPYCIEIFPLPLNITPDLARSQNLKYVIRKQIAEADYYSKVTPDQEFGAIVVKDRDEFINIAAFLGALLLMPRKLVYALHVLTHSPSNVIDKLAAKIIPKEPYPKWFDKEREKVLKKRALSLEKWLMAFTKSSEDLDTEDLDTEIRKYLHDTIGLPLPEHAKTKEIQTLREKTLASIGLTENALELIYTTAERFGLPIPEFITKATKFVKANPKRFQSALKRQRDALKKLHACMLSPESTDVEKAQAFIEYSQALKID